MGYQPKRKTFVLKFEDDEYEGLVVKAKSLKLGSLMQVAKLAQMDVKNVQPEDIDKLGELFETFAGALIEWNLEDEETGEPVPTTVEGIESQDVDFMFPIVKAWFNGIAGVTGPLGRPSPNGVPSPELAIPMEAR